MVFLYLGLFLLLVAFALASTFCSIVAGFVSGIVVSFVSVVKSCVVGIKKGVSNMFIKVVLYIILGITVAIIAAPFIYIAIMILLSIIGIV